MKNTIIALLSLLTNNLWASALIDIIKSTETRLVSEVPGDYTVSGLIAELEIRNTSMKESKIECIGMTELRDQLKSLSTDQAVKSLVFKNNHQTGIVYLDSEVEKVIGGILITTV